MKINPNAPASGFYRPDMRIESGLTIRQHFAAMAMSGLCSHPELFDLKPNQVAFHAVEYADALIAELNK